MTLIEVLITIVVFTSGILVILSIITSSLSLWRRSRNRTNATMFAKEWLEMMYSIRDTNLDRAQLWWCIPPDCAYSLSSIANGTILTVEATGTNKIKVDQGWNNAKLYITTWANNTIVYTHANTGQPSPYYRTLTITDALVPSSDQNFVNSQIRKISSKVRYPQLWGTGEVVIESFIGLTRQ